MDLLETKNSKHELLKKSAQQQRMLQDELQHLSARAEKIVTNALVIGGSLLISYYLVRQFMGSKKKSKSGTKKLAIFNPSEQPNGDGSEKEESLVTSVLSDIGAKVAGHMATLLLTLAREKLMDFLESQIDKKNEPDEHPEHTAQPAARR